MEIKNTSWTNQYMKDNGLFSIPYVDLIEWEYYKSFITEHNNWIHDIYITAPITPPFFNDSMGKHNEIDGDNILETVKMLLDVCKPLNIDVSLTYNNTSTLFTYETMLTFIDNFKPLYEIGVRNITLPSVTWMLTGKIKETYPDLFIKNTVLMRVRDGQMFWDHVKAGFDYINIDRELIRNEDQLKDIKKAQKKYFNETGNYVPIAILANESCKGKCPVMDEHYFYNQNSILNNKTPYFGTAISSFTCPKWSREIPGYQLKLANITPIPSEIEWITQYVDIFKLHGRSTHEMLMDSINLACAIIYGHETEIPFDKELYNKWLKVTKNCKFQCYNCNLCDDVAMTVQNNFF